MFPEDWWLGSAFWRLVGADAPLQLFSLGRQWGGVYVDNDGFRVKEHVAIFHNRGKISSARRLRLLHAFARVRHCSPSLRWKLTDANCCDAGNASRGRHGGGTTPWPMHQASRTGCHSASVDLRNRSVQRALGIVH